MKEIEKLNLKNKKNYIFFFLIIIMSIGFAAVTTTLVLNATTNIVKNEDSFDIYFSKAMINGSVDNSVIIDDKNIVFNKEFMDVSDTYILDYFITNGSKQYDADVNITCTDGNEYVTVINSWVSPTEIKATETKNGKLSLEMIKSYVGDEDLNKDIKCTIEATAKERNSNATGTPEQKVVNSNINN